MNDSNVSKDLLATEGILNFLNNSIQEALLLALHVTQMG
jgi:hypothetical protein